MYDQVPVTQLRPLIAQEYMYARLIRSSLTLEIGREGSNMQVQTATGLLGAKCLWPISCWHYCIDFVCLSEKCRSKANYFSAVFVHSTETLLCLDILLDMLLVKFEPEVDLDA